MDPCYVLVAWPPLGGNRKSEQKDSWMSTLDMHARKHTHIHPCVYAHTNTHTRVHTYVSENSYIGATLRFSSLV